MLSPSYPPQSPSQIRKLEVGFETSAGMDDKAKMDRKLSSAATFLQAAARLALSRPLPYARGGGRHAGCRPTPREEAVLQAAAVRPERSKQVALTSTTEFQCETSPNQSALAQSELTKIRGEMCYFLMS